MASSTLQKFLRNQSHSAIKSIGCFPKSYPPLPSFGLTDVPQITKSTRGIPCSDILKLEDLRSSPRISSPLYPTFPFGFYVNPVSPSPSIGSEPDEESQSTVIDDDSRIIKADSVKKKRKKKMNKHKLRKLRKRLRRKT